MSRVETANKTNPQHTAVHVAATGADCHWKDDSGEGFHCHSCHFQRSSGEWGWLSAEDLSSVPSSSIGAHNYL